MPRKISPREISPPLANYSHAVLVEAGSELLFCSGQVGMEADGTIPATVREQAALCFLNIEALLREAGMERSDIVRLNAYVTDRTHLSEYMRERDRFLDGLPPPPASTLMIVTGFAREEFKVEVEALAACKSD